jgi:hypothetical protein
MLSDIYSECPLVMLDDIYAECHLCRVSQTNPLLVSLR